VGGDGGERTVYADTVILAVGRVPNKGLANAIAGKVPEVYEIGDCLEPRRIAAAIHDAAYFSREI